MKFRSMFKVRQPGNGSKVEESLCAACKKVANQKFPSKDNSQNSGPKTPVK